MMRLALLTGSVLCVGFVTLDAQAICDQPSAFCRQQTADSRRLLADGQRASFEQLLVHNGKWLTAAGVAAFTVLGATEHRRSRREWDALLTLCRSDQAACTVGSDGRYERPDAEALYQRSRSFDRRANKWLVGAQVSLIVTTALFIIDLNPGEGPENIPFPANRLDVWPAGSGAGLGIRLPF